MAAPIPLLAPVTTAVPLLIPASCQSALRRTIQIGLPTIGSGGIGQDAARLRIEAGLWPGEVLVDDVEVFRT